MDKSLRILVVDDNEMMSKTLKDILKIKGHVAEVAHTGTEALKKLEQNNFACVLSDIKMPGLNGVDLFREIKTRQPDIPVVLMTAYATTNLIQEGLDEGVVAVLKKPLDLDLLLKFLDYLKQERSVIIVDDDPEFSKTLADILQTRDFSVIQIIDPYYVMENLKSDNPIVLLDMKLNGQNGLDILYQIRKQYPQMPVILVTGYRDEVSNAIETAMKINAYTCFYKPLQIEKLLETLTKIHHENLGRVLGQQALKKS